MSSSKSSYRIQYDLRPAKQVERRMLVDALQRLAAVQFPIADYQYTGFGSFYFVDFTMFHKLLGMSDLLSLEHDPALQSRVEFNRPFSCVRVRIASAGTEIPNLNRDKHHLLWLDYDGVLHRDFLSDIQSALTVLQPGSILLITVDVEPPEIEDYISVDPNFDSTQNTLGPREWKKYFEYHAADFLELGMTESDFAKSKLRDLTISVLNKAFKKYVLPRPKIEFLPLFNFVYRDSHWMVTMGGMIAGEADRRRVRGSTVVDMPYYRSSFTVPAFEITVPRLTRKERLYLDRQMPCANDWKPSEFQIDGDLVLRYRDIYRFLPAFAELLL